MLTTSLAVDPMEPLAADNQGAPLFSLVVPCYKVTEYLPAFLASLDEQLSEAIKFEVIFVVDGCPDGSDRLIGDWQRESRVESRLLVTENFGVSSARTSGLALARGEWVTFPDPDDELGDDYLLQVASQLTSTSEIDLIATRLVKTDSNKSRTLSHPLDFRFGGGTRVVELDVERDFVQIAVHTAFFLRARIQTANLAFDSRLRVLEDGKFVAEYLLASPTQRALICTEAHYFYKVREDGTSALQTSTANLHERYVTTLAYAHLPLLEKAGSECPRWLANILLYDLYWLFKLYVDMKSSVHSFTDEQNHELEILSREVLAKIGLENVQAFRLVNNPMTIRTAWESAAQPGAETHIAILRGYDDVRELQKIIFYSTDSKSDVGVFRNGDLLETPFRKARELSFFDSVWIYEHILWVHTAPTENADEFLTVEDLSGNIQFAFGGLARDSRETGRILEKVPRGRSGSPIASLCESISPREARARSRKRSARERRTRIRYSIAFRAGKLLGWHRKFAEAWVFIDRNVQANDNAEALYRYVQENRKDINAWFVIDKHAADWKRLKSAGFRLVAQGSKQHFVLMKFARVLTSSMIDQHIVQPFPKKFLSKTWSFSFLQHGVIHNALHRWLNTKYVDHFVTSTESERDHIAGTPSPYQFSDREVALSDMPRHDRLFRLWAEEKREESAIKRLIVMPTWRSYLLGAVSGSKRELLDGFDQSEFATQWTEFLNGDFMTDLLQRDDTEVVFLPHPGVDEHWHSLRLPKGMKRASYVGDDVQKLLAGSSVAVTDYSSQAFEAAYCEVPTAYFQFDRDEFFGGGHTWSPGYFSHEEDGFGPISSTRLQLETDVAGLLNGTHPELPEYRQRMSNLYAFKDGLACERTVGDIEQRLRPYGSASMPPRKP